MLPRILGRAVFATHFSRVLQDSFEKQKPCKHSPFARLFERLDLLKPRPLLTPIKQLLKCYQLYPYWIVHLLIAVLPCNLQMELDKCEQIDFRTLCPLLRKFHHTLATAQAYSVISTVWFKIQPLLKKWLVRGNAFHLSQ